MKITKSDTTIHGGPGPEKRELANKRYAVNQKLRGVIKSHQKGFLSDRMKEQLLSKYQEELREVG